MTKPGAFQTNVVPARTFPDYRILVFYGWLQTVGDAVILKKYSGREQMISCLEAFKLPREFPFLSWFDLIPGH